MFSSVTVYGWGTDFGHNPDPRYTIAEVGPVFKNTQFGDGPNRFDIDILRSYADHFKSGA